jgi:23S rRNA (adenine2503-C2)-methyltransferase
VSALPREDETARSPRALSALLFEPEDLAREVAARGGRPFHARILRERVLGAGVLDYALMTSLPERLREALAQELPLLAGRELERSVAKDRTTKLLLGFARAEGAGLDTIETVHIPALKSKGKDSVGPAGATLCVSTQAGCPVACPFCASGRLGLSRNLAAHEILEQFLFGRALGPLSRSVVMGIGEPLLNFEATLRALRLVHAELGIGARKITLSSVGFPARVRAAALERPPFQLAISLHTPFDEERDLLVPAMKGTPIDEIIAAGDFWFETTGRELTYEYVLLGGTNDTREHAAALARRLAAKRCSVNLIPFNPVRESGYRRPLPEHVEAFRELLEAAGVVATVRWSRGLESDAACGQLRLRGVEA